MNCDFTLSGCLPEAELQEKVIAFYRNLFSRKIDLTILPEPDQRYKTRIYSAQSGRSLVVPNYPFNFFGVIPIATERLSWNIQMVFDRSAGGRLVRISKLPDAFGIPPKKGGRSKETCEVVLYEGGRHSYSLSYGYEIALLLNVIRMRWWPDLSVSDDDHFFEKAAKKNWQYGLVDKFMDEDLDSKACMDLFCEEYSLRNHLSI